jgi:hypothetical protein
MISLAFIWSYRQIAKFNMPKSKICIHSKQSVLKIKAFTGEQYFAVKITIRKNAQGMHPF